MNMKKIAYLLVVHKSPNQVNKFIEQLQNIGDCDIYIHVDSKSRDIISQITSEENIYIFSEYDVKWGSFEIVESAIFLMKEIIKSNKKYDHIYFGSGQDLIIKNGLLDYLNTHKNDMFIKIQDEPINRFDRRTARYKICWPKGLLIRNDLHIYRFIRIGLSILCKFGINLFPNKKQLQAEVKFYEGRTWFIIPYEVMSYIVEYLENNKDYIEFWRDSLASDLMFFQTIIMNSPYKNLVQDELMFVEFGKKFSNMNHPYTLTLSDIERLESSNKFFARKFEEKIDNRVIDYFVEKIKF